MFIDGIALENPLCINAYRNELINKTISMSCRVFFVFDDSKQDSDTDTANSKLLIDLLKRTKRNDVSIKSNIGKY